MIRPLALLFGVAAGLCASAFLSLFIWESLLGDAGQRLLLDAALTLFAVSVCTLGGWRLATPRPIGG